MNDREFLAWLHERLVYRHGENQHVDFLHKLRGIIKATPADRDSAPFSGSIAGETKPLLVRGRVIRSKKGCRHAPQR